MADVGTPPLESMPHDWAHLRHANQTLNAVSFGFIATAVLFAMFLVMAIFERILRPHRAARAAAQDEERAESVPESSADSQKPDTNAESYSKAVSVLMPGQDYPTYFARPIPPPCPPGNAAKPPREEFSDVDLTEKENFHDLEKGLRETCRSVDPHTSQTEVFQHVVKEKGESSSPASPGKKFFQDGETAK
ncbi:hypothetical protein R1flu_012597 [Riccia fluitans]|uniref:Uncharacterized protein n=1 Tax=Riccia fluitans TaxID=41844 RepID=A0ABD1ZB84_9MARC